MAAAPAISRFNEQVAVVTGGSRGIGRAIALQLASEGARVVVNFHRAAEKAETVVAEISDQGGQALAVQADVRDEDSVRRLIRHTLDTFERIDVLVANAATVRDQLAAVMTVEQWDTVLSTNLRGPFLCIREALPQMMRQRSGSIVCISSIVADRPGRGKSNYVAAKGGLNSLTRALAVELAPKGIRVNAVAPGVISTEMSKRVPEYGDDEFLDQIPLKRLGEPNEVARAVCFLASEDASYITGEILYVTGGFGL